MGIIQKPIYYKGLRLLPIIPQLEHDTWGAILLPTFPASELGSIGD
ncbi:hypothetical protein BPSP_0935 [Bifidobacterium pseudolongum subsp. pseudolongum]|nr:hypothetical protein BPSP_0935 [Bifidobacterium pseudolongum subsp. pseudolongum]